MPPQLMNILSYSFAGNSVAGWIVALLIFLVVLAGLFFLKKFSVRRLKALAGRVPYGSHLESIAELIGKTGGLLIFLIAGFCGLYFLNMPRISNKLPMRIIKIILIVQAAIWCIAFINIWIRNYKKQRMATDPSSVTTIATLGVIIKFFLS